MHIAIKPLFETTLVEPVQLGKFHEKGAKVVINQNAVTDSFGKIVFIAPSPTLLSLNEACLLADEATRLKNELKNTSKVQIMTDNKDPKWTAEQELAQNPNAERIVILDTETVYRFLQIAMAFHFAVIAAVEVFCTQHIPSDYEMRRHQKPKGFIQKTFAGIGIKRMENLSKADIERRLSIVEKLELLAEIKGVEDMKQSTEWRSFRNTKKTRDSVVHQKNGGVAIAGYAPLYGNLIDVDFQESTREIVALLNKFLSDPILIEE